MKHSPRWCGDTNSKPDQKLSNFGEEVNSPFYPRTVKALISGDERILETARLVNSPESQESQATQTPATAWSYRESDTFSRINVCKYPSFNRDVVISHR